MTPPLAMHFALIWIVLSALFVALGETQQSLSVAPEVEKAAIRIVEGMPPQ